MPIQYLQVRIKYIYLHRIPTVRLDLLDLLDDTLDLNNCIYLHLQMLLIQIRFHLHQIFLHIYLNH